LEEAADKFNETSSLIVLCEQSSVSEKTAITAALTAPAQEALIAGATDCAEQHLVFATANEQGSIADQVRKLCKLDASSRAGGVEGLGRRRLRGCRAASHFCHS